MTLKLVLGCVRKWSVGHIQTGNTYFFLHRFVEVCGEGAGWVFILVWLNWLLWFISKFLQVIFQTSFCWLLTCVYHIYWIRVHWYWNLSLGMLENCQWAIYQPDIEICFLCRFVKGHGEGASFCDLTCNCQYIDCLQCSS